jgi:hypothetical protein
MAQPNLNTDHIMSHMGELVGVHTHTGSVLSEEQRQTIDNKLNEIYGHLPSGNNWYLRAKGEDQGAMKLGTYVNPLLA